MRRCGRGQVNVSVSFGIQISGIARDFQLQPEGHHRHNLRDRLATPYLQTLGLNKVYHSDLMHNVSQLPCL
jgi:hypothetical protein